MPVERSSIDAGIALDALRIAPRPAERPVFACAAIGSRLLNLQVNVSEGDLVISGEVQMPSRVQYAWPHPVLPILYVACADRAPGAGGQPFFVCAMHRDETGALAPFGPPVQLLSRPIHLAVAPDGRHLLIAYSAAPGLTVHRLADDGSVEEEVPAAPDFSSGANPHQVRVLPGGRLAVIVARGRKGFGTPSHVPGGLVVVRFDRGTIENVSVVSPGPEQVPGGFNPRHLDFHPTLPLAYVALEEQNRLCVFRLNDSGFDPSPIAQETTLAHPADVRERQDCGTVRVHPNGRYVFVANRNDGYVGGHNGPSWIVPDPVPVFPGGENNIATFALDASGLPQPARHTESHGLHPRTFALDATGKLLLAGNLAPTRMHQQGRIVDIPANLAVFRIADDGSLEFKRSVPLETGREMLWWAGMLG